MPDSPPPTYSPPRPPPPYEAENNKNEHKDAGCSYKISPPPFAPLTGPSPMDPSTLHNIPLSNPPTIVVVQQEVKQAPSFSPYVTYCPKCAVPVTSPAVYPHPDQTMAPFPTRLFLMSDDKYPGRPGTVFLVIGGKQTGELTCLHLDAIAIGWQEQNITTKQTFVSGSLTWIVFILVLFFFFPLAFVPFCLDSCKDVHHYCPKCSQLLSIRKRFL